MTINIEPKEIGTSIKVYITKQDLEQESMKLITNDLSKDFRKQKTYKLKNFSEAKSILLKKIMENLYNQYSYFCEIVKNNDVIAQDAIKSKLYSTISTQIDVYDKRVFADIFNIAFGFIFDISREDEIDSLKNQYQLSEKDLMVTVIGTYGYGKTTLIKKIFGFDDFIFPLVDRGRTTINNCYLRGMLLHDNKIQNKNVESYLFKNQITLYSSDEFFQHTLLIQLAKAFNKYEESDQKEQNKRDIEVLREFISTDAANLDELFGDIDEFNQIKKPDSFYINVLAIMSSIKSTQNEKESLIETISKLKIREEFQLFYEHIISEVLKDLKSPTYEKNIITFYLTIDKISKIDNYYMKFISNKSELRGQLVRSLVKSIYLEVDLSTEEVSNSTINSKDIDSILFTDTIGAGHTTNTATLKGSESIDINKNFSILNESDIILLLDDATQTMNSSTLQQIKLLDSYGLKEKTLLLYSKYNQFLKGDFKSDDEREKFLIDKFKQKLYEVFPVTQNSKSEKAKLIYEMFSTNKNQMIFLKGLVPYEYGKENNEGKTGSRKKRENRSAVSQGENSCDDAKAKILNSKKIENSTACLTELFDKISFVHQFVNELNFKRCTIESNIDDPSLPLAFSHYFDVFSKNNAKNEHEQYIATPPEWNTSEALCYKLYCGETGFYGTSRALFPLEDAKSEFMILFNDFFENVLELRIDGDDSLTEDFLKSKMKSIFTSHINNLFYAYFIQLNKADWKRLYSDGQNGVKGRRSRGIYNLIEFTFSQNSCIKNSSFDFFVQSVNQVIDYYKS